MDIFAGISEITSPKITETTNNLNKIVNTNTTQEEGIATIFGALTLHFDSISSSPLQGVAQRCN